MNLVAQRFEGNINGDDVSLFQNCYLEGGEYSFVFYGDVTGTSYEINYYTPNISGLVINNVSPALFTDRDGNGMWYWPSDTNNIFYLSNFILHADVPKTNHADFAILKYNVVNIVDAESGNWKIIGDGNNVESSPWTSTEYKYNSESVTDYISTYTFDDANSNNIKDKGELSCFPQSDQHVITTQKTVTNKVYFRPMDIHISVNGNTSAYPNATLDISYSYYSHVYLLLTSTNLTIYWDTNDTSIWQYINMSVYPGGINQINTNDVFIYNYVSSTDITLYITN